MNDKELIEGLVNIDINLSQEMQKVINAKKDIDNKTFRICFCGVFKSGKSSLINNLLDWSNLLPTRVTTATAVVTEINYSDVPYAIAITNDNKKITISIDNVDEYILAQQKTLNGVISNDIKKVIIGIPCSVLKNNIVFVDTPGLYDDVRLTEITTHQIEISDFAVIVYDAGKLMSSGETRTLAILDTYLGNNFVTVVNKIDTITEIEEIQEACTFYFGCSGYSVNKFGNVIFTSSNINKPFINELKSYLKVVSTKRDSISKSSRILCIKVYLQMLNNDLIQVWQDLIDKQKLQKKIEYDEKQRILQNSKQEIIQLKIRLSSIVAKIPSLVEPFKQASIQIAMNERLFSSDKFQYNLLSMCLLKTKEVFCHKFNQNILKLLNEFNYKDANNFNPDIDVTLEEFDECVSVASMTKSGLVRKMGVQVLGDKFYNQVTARFESSHNIVYMEGYSILLNRKFRVIEKGIEDYIKELDSKYANYSNLHTVRMGNKNSNGYLMKNIQTVEQTINWVEMNRKQFN